MEGRVALVFTDRKKTHTHTHIGTTALYNYLLSHSIDGLGLLMGAIDVLEIPAGPQ